MDSAAERVERFNTVNGPRWTWNIHITGNDSKLLRLMKAIIQCGGRLTDSHVMHLALPLKYASVVFAVSVPKGWEQDFADMARCELERPPRAQVGMTPAPPTDQPHRIAPRKQREAEVSE